MSVEPPGVNVKMLFTAVIYELTSVFVSGKPFQPSPMFAEKDRSLP
jgi:hypothetical protein